VTDIAYLVPGQGLETAELDRREGIANELTDASVTVLDADHGPLSIESEVEHELSVRSLLGLLRDHETDYDAFVIGCFGDPGSKRPASSSTNPSSVRPQQRSIRLYSFRIRSRV